MSISNIANLGALSPQVSKAIDADTKLAPVSSQSVSYSKEVADDAEGIEVLAIDDDKNSRTLPLEVYEHYAKIQREYEDADDLDGLYEAQRKQLADPHSNVSESKLDAQRKLRAAKLYSVFFLITTDILGPSNAPYAIAQMGYVPGIILYVLFGAFAFIGGYMLNRAFLLIDSNNYPVRTYSDLGGRTIGNWFRFVLAFLQFFQMIFNVGLILLSSGTSLAQIIKATPQNPKLCFSICVLVWALLGMILGQIRSLRSFSHIANSAVWMNIAICIITMVGVATGPPNFQINWQNYGHVAPYDTTAILKYAIAPGDLSARIGGMNNMVFAWGGATIFCEVMAELRHPRDFWKGMLAAQTLILVIYVFYGVFVYSYQGQWSYVTANMGITQYKLQTAGNVLSLVSGVLAAVLYGNVGLKVLYQGFMVPDLKFPQLTTMRGAFVWAILVFVYWAIAFVVGSAIPSISTLVGIIGAVCILNFSYTFPPLFLLAVLVRHDAAKLDNIDVQNFVFERYDRWTSFARWRRGFCGGDKYRILWKFLLVLMFLASLCTFGLCFYSAILGAEQVWSTNAATSFGCSPNV